jgi:hypothetical protein
VRDLAQYLRPLPAIQLLGTTVPVPDNTLEVAHEDAVMREIEEARLLAELLVGRTNLAQRLANSGHQPADHQAGREKYDQRRKVEWIGHRNGERWRDVEIGDAEHCKKGYQGRRDKPPGERQEYDDDQVSQHGHRDVQPEPIADHGHQQYGGAPEENLEGQTPKVGEGGLLHRNPVLMVSKDCPWYREGPGKCGREAERDQSR